MLARPIWKKKGIRPSTAPTRLRKIAWAPLIGIPRSETTLMPRQTLPRVWPLKIPSQKAPYPQVRIKKAMSAGPQIAAEPAEKADSRLDTMNTATIIIVILISAPLAKRFGKKTVCAVGFAFAAIGWLGFYFLSPTNVWGMIGLTEFTAIVYAPSIPLTWAIFADTADYSEWKTGRRFTGMVFATIMFALKAGLALGSAAFLMIMKWFFEYDTKMPDVPETVHGFRFCVSILTGLLFAICTVLLFSLPLNKRTTIQMANELAERRKALASAAG